MTEEAFSRVELELAARNHGFLLETLDYPVTPIGLHYLLIHYDVPRVDASEWRLQVDGLVRTPLSLSLDEIRARPAVELVVTMECAGNGRAWMSPRPFSQPWGIGGVGTARWRGAPLRPILEEAGLADGAVEIVFTGLDAGIEGTARQHYARSLTVDEACGDDVVLAYEMNGVVLPPQHGYPLRLLVPGWYGMTSVKWLGAIEVTDEPFTGHQQLVSYRVRTQPDEVGEPITRMRPRALMRPPGVPHFPSLHRTVEAGVCQLSGRAWSGLAPVERVEVSTDRARSWTPATIEPAASPFQWCAWTFRWEATPGEHELACRAFDADGNGQPLEPEWNLGGYVNNAVQRIAVTAD